MPALADASFTWADLVALEPGLSDLEHDITSIEAGPRFCASTVWVRSLKPRMTALVGPSRGASPMQREPGQPLGEPDGLWDLMKQAETESAGVRRKRRRDARKGRGVLWTSDAYDIAYAHLYGLLPDCADACTCQQMTDALLGLPRGCLHG
jgi:hypothetical protein